VRQRAFRHQPVVLAGRTRRLARHHQARLGAMLSQRRAGRDAHVSTRPSPSTSSIVRPSTGASSNG
jgi:hypothetical protein